jgi:type IV pilus assembly protein PilQ
MNKQNIMAWRRGPRLHGVAAGAGASMSAQAQSTVVESVSSSLQGGVEVVRIDFSQPLEAVPAGFAIQSPARIALDIPGASNGLGRVRRSS